MNETNSNREELLRQLSLIIDPITRLQQYFAYPELKDIAENDLNELIKGETINFQATDREEDYRQIDKGERKSERRWVICFKNARALVTINGLQEYFGWKKRETRAFVISCLEKAITMDARYLRVEIESWAGSHEINATARAFEEYVPRCNKLYRKIFLWLLTGWFFHEAYLLVNFHDDMYKKWLGGTPLKLRQTRDINHPDQCLLRLLEWAEVYRLLDKKLRELGMNPKEVERLFADWLVKYGNKGLNPELVVAVLEAGVVYTHKFPDVQQALAGRLDNAFHYLSHGYPAYSPVIVNRLARAGMANTPQAKERYIDLLVNLLAEGKLGGAMAILASTDESFGCKGLELSSLAAVAVDRALKNQRFGVVVGLVNVFGADTCIDPALLTLNVDACDGDQAEAERLAIEERRNALRDASSVAKLMNQTTQLDLKLPYVTVR